MTALVAVEEALGEVALEQIRNRTADTCRAASRREFHEVLAATIRDRLDDSLDLDRISVPSFNSLGPRSKERVVRTVASRAIARAAAQRKVLGAGSEGVANPGVSGADECVSSPAFQLSEAERKALVPILMDILSGLIELGQTTFVDAAGAAYVRMREVVPERIDCLTATLFRSAYNVVAGDYEGTDSEENTLKVTIDDIGQRADEIRNAEALSQGEEQANAPSLRLTEEQRASRSQAIHDSIEGHRMTTAQRRRAETASAKRRDQAARD